MKYNNSFVNNNFSSNIGICDSDVAIIGLGFRLPGYNNNTPKQFYQNLKDKFNGIVDATTADGYSRWSKNYVYSKDIKSINAGLISIDEWKSFDPLFFGISPSEANQIDPQQRLLLKSTYESMEDAGIDPFELRGTNTSVYIGNLSLDYQKSIYNDQDCSINMLINNFHTISNRISYCFDFRGQSLTLDTACSSSSNAIHLGYESIVSGASDYSIVGGSNLLLDTQLTKSLSYLSMLSSTGYCKSFDATADGYVRSEGVGVVILKKLSLAIRDNNNIYCVIKGSNTNSDGTFNKSNFFSPSMNSQYENIKLALSKSNISPKDIDYFEAHGTGTPVGDPIELESISMIIKDYKSDSSPPLLIGSVKSNIGHLESSSGIASLIKCCIMYKYREFLPNIHFNTPNPSIKFKEWKLKVVTEVLPFPTNKKVIMCINNFGATGSNSCLVLSEYNSNNGDSDNRSDNDCYYLIPSSFNSSKSLEEYQFEIIDKIQDYSNNLSFKEFVLNQIYCKTQRFQQRSVIISNNWKNLKYDIKNQIKTSNNKSYNLLYKNIEPQIVFVMCGQGPQYSNMALNLYENNLIFKNSMDLLNSKLSSYSGFNILEKLRSIKSQDKVSINDPLIAQTSLFMVQVSLIELYKHWGISPSYLIGHSFGELTSIYCSGMISLDDACYLVYQRARLQSLTVTNDHQDKSNNFRMLVINISKEQFNQLYSSKYPDVEISCYNSSSSIVLGGREDKLQKILLESKENGTFSTFLGSMTSFHSSTQDSIKDSLLNLSHSIKFNNPTIPVFSTVTSELFNQEIIENGVSSYLFRNVREPVKFNDAIENLLKLIESKNENNKLVFLELSPHPTLLYYIKETIPKESIFYSKDSISVLSSLNKNKNDIGEINNTISQLYCQGYSVNFKSQFINSNNNIEQIISKTTSILPKYKWDDSKYWLESEKNSKLRNEGSSINQLGFKIQSTENSYQSFIDINKEPFNYLRGQIVKDKYFFPASGLIDNSIRIFGSNDFKIQFLNFKSPLILKEGKLKQLKTTFYSSNGSNQFNIQFNFKKKNEWVETSNGKIQILSSKLTSSNSMDIEELKSRCSIAKLSKDQLYKQIKEFTGLVYLDKFQRVEQCYHGVDCSLSKLSLLPRITNYKDSFLDPTILDSAQHGILSLVDEKCQIVIDRIEDYTVYTTNIPSIQDLDYHNELYVYSELLDRVGDSFITSLTILLSDGTILIDANKIVFKSLTPIKDSLEIECPNNQLYTFHWQERDSLFLNNLKEEEEEEEEETQSIVKVISDSINENLHQKILFKILQVSNNQENDIKLSNLIIELINKSSSDNNVEVDIEFTIGVESSSINTQDIKSQLSKEFINGPSLLIKQFYQDNEDNEKLESNYYDIIVSINKQLNLYNCLNYNGYLIHNNSNIYDENFKINVNINSNLIISQKPSILSPNLSINYDQIIIYNNSYDYSSNNNINGFIRKLKSKFINNNIISVNSFKEFEELKSSNNSIIYFISTINHINNQNQLIKVLSDFNNINQFIIDNKFEIKLILVSVYSQKESLNFSNSVFIGSKRYYDRFNTGIVSIDLDQQSLDNERLIENIQALIENSNSGNLEFIIRNNIVYCERIKKETNLKLKFKSESYHQDIENLQVKLDPTSLEYKLESKQSELDENHVEIKTISVGLNFKDTLVYYNGIKDDDDNNGLGYDGTGIITRVGSNASKEFKVGDKVFGLFNNATSSHVYQHKDKVILKPPNLTDTEASIIATSFITSYYSLFYCTNLNFSNSSSKPISILIHSGSSGIGIATLNLLKWKTRDHKQLINLFITVSSDEKRDYLIDTYGEFINGGIYTRDINYPNEIKKKLKEINGSCGIDLIINTLSNEFIELNFKLLSSYGKIIDLVTSDNHHESLDFSSFRFKNNSYSSINISTIPNEIIKQILNKLSLLFSSQSLELPPIKEYSSINNIKEALELLNSNYLIGKISIKMDDHQNLIKSLTKENNNQFYRDYNILKSNYQITSNIGETILINTGSCNDGSCLINNNCLQIIKWLLKYSKTIKTILILVSNNDQLNWKLEKIINQNIDGNIEIIIIKNRDGSNYEELKSTINESFKIETIFNFMINDQVRDNDSKNLPHYELITNNISNLNNIHNLTIERKWNIKSFIIESTLESTFSNDNFNNSCLGFYLNSFSKYRQSIGLPSLTINFNSKDITSNLLLGSIDLLIQNSNVINNSSSNYIVNNFNESFIKNYLNHPSVNKINFISNAIKSKSNLLSSSEVNVNENVLNKISELLSIESSRINGDITLQEFGADSLIMVSLKNYIDKEYIANLFTLSQLQTITINNIIQNIIKSTSNNKSNKNNKLNNNSSNNNNLNYWKEEVKLNNSIKPKPNSKVIDIHQLLLNKDHELNVFLTGTTGYFGSYMLAKLLKRDKVSSIYCLVRNRKSNDQALEAILNSLNNHQLLDDNIKSNEIKKIKIIMGDLSMDRFNLTTQQYNLLSSSINLIINCGADTNVTAIYEETKLVNVKATTEMIKLACHGDYIKPLVHISTFSSLLKTDLKDGYPDSYITPIEKIHENENGYATSKIVTEYLMKEASNRGIPSMVLRLPYLFSNPITGIGNRNDFVQLYLQTSYQLKVYPKDYLPRTNVAPITWVSDSVTSIILNEKAWSLSSQFSIYNIISDTINISDLLIDLIKDYSLKAVDLDEWESIINNSKLESCVRLKTFHYFKLYEVLSSKHLKASTSTIALLESMNINYSDSFISYNMIKNHLNYINKLYKLN